MRRNNYQRIGWMLMATVMLLLFACNKEDNELSGDKQNVNRNKICVIAPYSQLGRWERTAKWALENIVAAQKGLPQCEELELVWMNEEKLTEGDYTAISEDESYVAVVGPFDSKNADILARAYRKTTMLLPTATSAEFQRKFADNNNVWNLAESDISQMQVMLAQIASEAIKEVVLITRKNDPHGETFVNWIGFFATENKINIEGIYTYESAGELKEIVKKVNAEKYATPIIFDAGNDDDAIAFDKAIVELIDSDEPYTLGKIRCTDNFVSEHVAKKVEMNYEGLDLSADPATGFGKAYEQKFGEELISGEAQFYDAFLLLAYALTAQRAHPELTLNEAITEVVTSEGGEGIEREGWLPADSYHNFRALQNSIFPVLTGVSGSWNFEEKSLTSVTSSTYRHWRLDGGKYYTMDFLTAEGVAAWNMTGQVFQEFDEGSEDLIYPPLKDQWCLLVATSTQWADYRHQSDVFAMYQIMKKYGFKDDHIVLIAEDNLANHPSNPLKGQVLAEPIKNNVYQNIKVDYKISQINTNDFKDILCGNSSERLPEVIKSGVNDNVFIFWSGHGTSRGFFKFGDEFIASAQLKNIFSTMHNEKKYRKMFMAMEACYSGQVGQACRGIPGILFMTAANDIEQSWSWTYNNNVIGPFLSDKFARYFQISLETMPYYSFQSLYKELAKTVSGSHVSIYNEVNFGNMYNNNISEFITYGNSEMFK